MVMEFKDRDSIIQALEESELGIALAKDNELFRTLYKGPEPADGDEMHRLIYGGITYKDKIDFEGNGKHITVRLFPLMYVTPNPILTFAKARHEAVMEVFIRWADCGYNKRCALSPYKSKLFMDYLWDLEFTKADWMILMERPKRKEKP